MFVAYFMRNNRIRTDKYDTFEAAMQAMLRGANAGTFSDIDIMNTETQHFTVINQVWRDDWFSGISEQMNFSYATDSFDNKWDHEGE